MKTGTRVQHVITNRKGVIHGPSADPLIYLVRWGRETRPTLVPVGDLMDITPPGDAPDLLSAARFVYALLSQNAIFPDELAKARASLKAAIDKAEGRQ